MPETNSPYMTRAECALTISNISNKLTVINEHTVENRKSVDKLSKILIGNGEEGLIIQIKRLSWRNQLMDKFVGLLVGIVSSLLTLWAVGVLHL